MAFRNLLTYAAVLTFIGASAASGQPVTTPVGGETDTVTITGVYAPSGYDGGSQIGFGSQPLAEPVFTLSTVLPAQVSISDPAALLPPPSGQFPVNASGSYTDGGQTETFSDLLLGLDDYISGYLSNSPTLTNLDLYLGDFLTIGDFFQLYGDTTLAPIYDFSGGGTMATAKPGVYSFVGDAQYGTKDNSVYISSPFTGTITVTPNGGAVSAAPEPSAWALMLSGLALIGGALRRRRTSGASALPVLRVAGPDSGSSRLAFLRLTRV